MPNICPIYGWWLDFDLTGVACGWPIFLAVRHVAVPRTGHSAGPKADIDLVSPSRSADPSTPPLLGEPVRELRPAINGSYFTCL